MLQEEHIYGSSRVGMRADTLEMIGADPVRDTLDFPLERGMKRYELSNHLGNVLTVISDQKLAIEASSAFDYYLPEVLAYNDYYPFGAPVNELSWSGEEYRFGFNGQEKDDEVAGSGNSYTAEYWQYDSRLGRRWNIDPKPRVGISHYSCLMNSPVLFQDPFGDTVIVGEAFSNSKTFKELRKEWRRQTGLNIYVNNEGQLDYTKTMKNGQLVPTVYHGPISQTARTQLISILSDPRMVTLMEGPSTYTDRGSSTIYFNPEMIENLSYVFQMNSPGMAPDAMSYGMVSYHEFDHWLNTNNNDPIPVNMLNGPGQTLMTGPTVDFENQIRSELTSSGLGDYGQRAAYYMRFGNLKVIPFTEVAKQQIIATGSLVGVQNVSFIVPGPRRMGLSRLEREFENQPNFER
jgi:RHS repeat-associated protein